MSAVVPLRGLDVLDGVEYPSSDGEPMAETETHVMLMTALIPMLRRHFEDHADVYVIGNIFLYYEEGNPNARRSPDVMVVKGVPKGPPRKSFKVWEENAVPCVVIELTSQKTEEEDQGPKKELYEQLGVREYFLFDPLADYLPRPLVGYRLVKTAENSNGDDPTFAEVQERYEELLPGADGGISSAELGLRLVPEGLNLEVIDLRTKKRLLTWEDIAILHGQLGSQLQQQEAQLNLRKAELERERQLRDQAQKELADLRAKLAAQPPPPTEGT